MERSDFLSAIDELRKFFSELNRLQDVLDAISPTSTAVVELGGFFIDSYIKVLSIASKCSEEMLSAFVFESNLGEYPLTGDIDGVDFCVKTADEFYDTFIPDTDILGTYGGELYPISTNEKINE